MIDKEGITIEHRTDCIPKKYKNAGATNGKQKKDITKMQKPQPLIFDINTYLILSPNIIIKTKLSCVV